MFLTFLTILSVCLSNVLHVKSAVVMENTSSKVSENELTLFDFTNNDTSEGWTELSDTVREVGMSKATLQIQKTRVFQRAIFFTLLNPQPNGAGFAGMLKILPLNLNQYDNILLRIRAQGQNSNYKVVLRHKNQNDEPHPTYEQFFTAPGTFETVTLPISNFKPYFRGRQVNDTEPLDKSRISSFGFQIYGGVYHSTKQSGPSSLEIDWIKAK